MEKKRNIKKPKLVSNTKDESILGKNRAQPRLEKAYLVETGDQSIEAHRWSKCPHLSLACDRCLKKLKKNSVLRVFDFDLLDNRSIRSKN